MSFRDAVPQLFSVGGRWGRMAGLLVAVSLAPCFAAGGDPSYDSGGSGEAQRLLAHAARSAYHGRYSEAIDLDTRALALKPSYGDAYIARSHHYEDAGLYAQAGADLERAALMRPDDMSLAMSRVRLALFRVDPAGAVAALKRALALPLHSSQHISGEVTAYNTGSDEHRYVTGHMESYADEYASIAEQLQHHDEASILAMQNMLKIETEHPEHILADYCFVAGVAGLLDSAEVACEQSIEDNAHDVGQYDSLGYVHVRMKQWDKAIADYNKALDDRDDLTLSLYGRGIAKRAKGDIAGGNADIAAATRAEPDIANIMKRMGVPTI